MHVASYELWHNRLGHVSRESVKILRKVWRRRTSHTEKGQRVKQPLELIHSDVLGPLKVSSFFGGLYLLTFVDDYSRKAFVVPIKSKEAVLNVFVKLKIMVESQCSKNIKTFRTDKGRLCEWNVRSLPYKIWHYPSEDDRPENNQLYAVRYKFGGEIVGWSCLNCDTSTESYTMQR